MSPRQRFQLSASVFMVLRRGADVLCLSRIGTGWADGTVSVPAGAVDGGETLLDAAVREAREEVGVEIAPDACRLIHTLHCQAGDSGAEWLGFFFQATEWSGQENICEPEKHADLLWCPVENLPTGMLGYVRQAIVLAERSVAYSAFGW